MTESCEEEEGMMVFNATGTTSCRDCHARQMKGSTRRPPFWIMLPSLA